MNRKNVQIIAIILVALFILLALGAYFIRRGSSGAATETPTGVQSFGLDLTPQPTIPYGTQIVSTIPVTPYGNAPNLACELPGCMWSNNCVSEGYSLDESGNGSVRVKPDSCIPINPQMWNIKPDNPFWGMPCSYGLIGQCVWSRQCVEDHKLAPVKNGLAPAYVDSDCTAYPLTQ
jgi:hypothetical protein